MHMKPFTAYFFTALIFCTINSYCQIDVSLSPADFQKQSNQSNAQILDVRTTGEYQSGHIHQSFLANWNNQKEFLDRVKYLDKSKPVYVYCLSGGRSAAAAQWMRSNGFPAVYELKGGINAWKNASLPLEGVADIKQLTIQEYKSQLTDNGFVLVDFSAEWCPPCKKMQPVVEQLQKERGNQFKLVKVDGGVNTRIMNELKIDGIPAFILYKNGREVWRKQGMTELEEFKKQIPGNS